MAYARRGDNMDARAKALEEIFAEVSSLKEQRHAAQAEAERAAERLKEISDRKAALTASTFLSEKR
jgi:predicted nuclease with TOPRIM domain